MAQVQRLGREATTVARKDSRTFITYHDTIVVDFDSRYVQLDSNGWYTNTTKTRMNQASNQFNLGYQVFQDNYNWYVKVYKDSDRKREHPIVVEYYDGMIIDRILGMVVKERKYG